MKSAIFITVRTASTRLKKKALLELVKETSTIEYLINRIKYSRFHDEIILCTTLNKEDDELVEIARKNGILYFRGSSEDKLERWLKAAEKYNIEYIITVDGDDLFCEPLLIDKAIKQFQESNKDFIQASGIICGAFTYGIKTTALKKACEIKDSNDTEIMWVYFTDTGLFNLEELHGVPQHYYRNDIRMTLDYEEDLLFFKEVLKMSKKGEKYISLDEIIDIIEKNPYIKNINYFRQNEFLSNQKAHTKIALKE